MFQPCLYIVRTVLIYYIEANTSFKELIELVYPIIYLIEPTFEENNAKKWKFWIVLIVYIQRYYISITRNAKHWNSSKSPRRSIIENLSIHTVPTVYTMYIHYKEETKFMLSLYYLKRAISISIYIVYIHCIDMLYLVFLHYTYILSLGKFYTCQAL